MNKELIKTIIISVLVSVVASVIVSLITSYIAEKDEEKVLEKCPNGFQRLGADCVEVGYTNLAGTTTLGTNIY